MPIEVCCDAICRKIREFEYAKAGRSGPRRHFVISRTRSSQELNRPSVSMPLRIPVSRPCKRDGSMLSLLAQYF
jgi:hypothetical protein